MTTVTVEPMHVGPAPDPAVSIMFSATVGRVTGRFGFAIIQRQGRVTVAEIRKVVSAHYGLTEAQLVSTCRARGIARPRQVSMWLTKQLTDRSLPDIGRRHGLMDHTTVLHAIRRVEALRAEDETIARDCELLLAKLGGFQT